MKKILIFSIISVISLLGINVKAYTITSEDTPYYFTFVNNSGKTFSDNLKIYYVDGRVSYCIEPGAKLGDGSDYTIGTDRNINSVKRDAILDYMYYGYKFYGHDDIKYYLATQALIWNVLLPKPGVTYSTELFKNGEIIDLTYYINEIKNTIKIFREGPYKLSSDTIYMGEELNFPLDNDIMRYFTVYNISGNMSYRFIGTTLNIYNTRKNGCYNINTKENDKYDQPFTVYISDDKQDLLSLGNIIHIPIYHVVTMESCKLKMHIQDANTLNSIGNFKYGLYNMNNKLIREVDINDEGYGSIDNMLQIGKYYLKMISAPLGYKLDKKLYYIEFNKDNPYIDITLYDSKTIGHVTLNVLDSNTDKPVSNTTINIYNDKNELVQSVTTDKEGKSYLDLEYGNYYYQEYESNEDYYMDDNIYELIIDDNKDYSITLLKHHKIVPIKEILNTNKEDTLIIHDVPNTNSSNNNLLYIALIGVLIVIKKVL